MSVLTYLTEAQITDSTTATTGKVLSRPALLATDGTVLVYVVDVDIGRNVILRNVPIARNNRELIFADAGAAVTLERSANGRYEIVGLSNEMPGTYTRFSVDLSDFTFGAVTDLSFTSRPLTYDELHIYGTYGLIPFGAVGVFQGGALLEVTS